MTTGIPSTQSGVANITSTNFPHESEPFDHAEVVKLALVKNIRELVQIEVQEFGKKLDATTEAPNTTRGLYKEASEKKVAKESYGSKPKPLWEVELENCFDKLRKKVDDVEELTKDACRMLPAQCRVPVAQVLTRAIHEAIAFVTDKLRIAHAFAAGLGNALFDVLHHFLKKLKGCVLLARGAIPETLTRNAVAIGTALA